MLDVSQSIKGFLFICNEFYPDSVRKMLIGQFDILVPLFEITKIRFIVKLQDVDRSIWYIGDILKGQSPS
jgi:hypothetical protein